MKPLIDKYTTVIAHLERRTLVGPMRDGQDVLKALHDAEWHTTYSGPYTNKRIHPRCDTSRFLFVAEREEAKS